MAGDARMVYLCDHSGPGCQNFFCVMSSLESSGLNRPPQSSRPNRRHAMSQYSAYDNFFICLINYYMFDTLFLTFGIIYYILLHVLD